MTRLPLYETPHRNHEKHLCSIVERGITIAEYKDLVRDPTHVCWLCGRVAKDKGSLCYPVPL